MLTLAAVVSVSLSPTRALAHDLNREIQDAKCAGAPTELTQVTLQVWRGLIGHDALERKRLDLLPCGHGDNVANLQALRAHGGGMLAREPGTGQVAVESEDPLARCDSLAASPFDANRRQGSEGNDVLRLALGALSGEAESGIAQIRAAIAACEVAARDRSRVARYKYNLGRSHYAMATIERQYGKDPQPQLAAASSAFQEAVELGYAAAYNALAQLSLNGEITTTDGPGYRRLPPDWTKAIEFLQRGASLDDGLASYNLGMAYRDGAHGLVADPAKAAILLAKASEAGLLAATIETALLFRDGRGMPADRQRAVQLLEIAAARGSSEAMYQLGELYRREPSDAKGGHQSAGLTANLSRAFLWHARASEVGDPRSQTIVAGMLQRGEGIPTHPEAAARFWRLAAEGASPEAHLKVARDLRDGRMAFKPKETGVPDAGAEEMRAHFLAAFSRGISVAGLELARLYASGYPSGTASKALPRDSAKAADLLRATMARVQAAQLDTLQANPQVEVQAAFELLKMHDAGTANNDGAKVIGDEEAARLRAAYGDPSQTLYVRVSALGGGFRCPGFVGEFWVLVWNWRRPEPPTDRQFDWFEAYHKCGGLDSPATEGAPGISKTARQILTREHQASLKAEPGSKTFVDRVAAHVSDAPSPKRKKP